MIMSYKAENTFLSFSPPPPRRSLALRAFSVKGTQDKPDQKKKKNPDNMDQGHLRIYIL